jgi:hypothetical protein
MNARLKLTLPALGAAMQGGHLHGFFVLDGQLWGEVTSPKAEGEICELPWLHEHDDVPGASSDFDGLANTKAMADAGSPIAHAAMGLRIGGFDDWYIPARGGQLLQWSARGLMPAEDALEGKWYWSSTQYSRDLAYFQDFSYGGTGINDKSWEGGRARAVRRFLIE